MASVALIADDVHEWTPEIGKAFDHEAFRPTDADPMPDDWYEREMQRGDLAATVWRYEASGKLLAVFLWRIEEIHGKREMVFVAARSLLPWANMRVPVLSAMEDYARSLGCVSARVHTSRAKWADWLEGFGYSDREFQLRKALT
ncbi:MAG: hypothetical protein AAFY01_01705 [Pseudomonadota bacterium]